MITLGIDASRAMKKEKTGVEWYSYFLSRAMEKFTPKDFQVKLYVSNSKDKWESAWEWTTLKWAGKGWTQARLSLEMIKNPPDILFVPSHSIPIVHPNKTITTIHDVVFLKNPELYDPKDLQNQIRCFDFAKQFAKKIIVPSNATKNDIIENGVKEEKVVVIPHGVRTELDNEEKLIDGPYILFVGRIEKKKNVLNLIQAFRKIKNIKLVLAGANGFGAADVATAMEAFKMKDKVVSLGWVDQKKYSALLKNAKVLVLPSFGEGFGLTAAEAMRMGTPAACSNIPVLREVGGNAVQYFNPHDSDNIAKTIQNVINNEMLQSEMIRSGKERAREYTWDKSAKLTWEAICGLIGR